MMLKWNWKKLFKARGIEEPVKWMVKMGISRGVATRIAENRVDMISRKNLTILCKALNCTPDDALEYEPTEAEKEKGELALLALGKSKNKPDEANLLRRLTYKDLREFAKLLRKKFGGGNPDRNGAGKGED